MIGMFLAPDKRRKCWSWWPCLEYALYGVSFWSSNCRRIGIYFSRFAHHWHVGDAQDTQKCCLCQSAMWTEQYCQHTRSSQPRTFALAARRRRLSSAKRKISMISIERRKRAHSEAIGLGRGLGIEWSTAARRGARNGTERSCTQCSPVNERICRASFIRSRATRGADVHSSSTTRLARTASSRITQLVAPSPPPPAAAVSVRPSSTATLTASQTSPTCHLPTTY